MNARSTIKALCLLAGIISGTGMAVAAPVVDVRFDPSYLTPDFEGRWAGLPVETVSAAGEGTAVETVVFSQPADVLAVDDSVAPRGDVTTDPLFVTMPLHPSGRSVVFGIAESGPADVVLLDNGQDQGFRTGMLCEITRDGQPVGEIILVEVRTDRAAGLITQLESGRVIRFGDKARIKTVQFL